MYGRYSFLLFLTTLCLGRLECKRLKDEIYVSLKDAHFCFRRTNGTHVFGCTSSINGNVGVVHYAPTDTDLKYLLSSEADRGDYIAILTPVTFSASSLQSLKDSGKITGVILIRKEDSKLPKSYSDDDQCPNAISSIYKTDPERYCPISTTKWNPGGGSVIMKDWSFPIFYVKDSDTVDRLLNGCFYKYNDPKLERDWPFCAVELRSHMYSAVDSRTCIRRSTMINNLNPTPVCDPMGDVNIVHFLSPRIVLEREKSVILITTRIDTMNLFDGVEIGAASPTIGLITLLSVAELLSSVFPFKYANDVDNVMFAFFNGESFDYIGSSRMTYDMIRGEFPYARHKVTEKGQYQLPLDIDRIKFIVEIGQMVSNDGKSKRLYAHVVDQDVPAEVSQIIAAIKTEAESRGFSLKRTTPLPPASLHSFLKVKRSIPGIVLTNYDRQFDNPYYHSIYDDSSAIMNYNYDLGIKQDLVTRISEIVEMTTDFIYAQATKVTKQFSADKTKINELLHCYLDKANCSMFRAALTPDFPPEALTENAPFPQYVGVRRSRVLHSSITYRLLALLTGERVPDADEETCKTPEDQNIYRYFFLKTENPPQRFNDCISDPKCGYCYRTSAVVTQAVSPAFIIEGYDFLNTTYIAWTESMWKLTSSRMFLMASPTLTYIHFGIGVAVLISSFLIVWWLNKKASIIFTLVPSTTSSNVVITEDYNHAEAL